MSEAASAYLSQKADERFETRLPRRLKGDAEQVASAQGLSLSEYVLTLLAERVAEQLPEVRQWKLTPDEQAMLLRVLAAPQQTATRLEEARKRAEAVFGKNP